MDWGTQLYISFIENIVIALLMMALGYWEYRKSNELLPVPKLKGKHHARVMA